MIASILGLASALVWGSADFCGGLSTRRAHVLGVLILAELSGFMLLVLFAFLFGEQFPASSARMWAIAAGLSGTVGLGSLYYGLSIGRASMVAPISAVIGAIIPAIFTAYHLGPPQSLQLLGFALALVAIVLASQAKQDSKGNAGMLFAVLAGFGFGGFFILMDQASGLNSTFFPLAIARGFPIPIMFLVSLARKKAPLPPKNTFGIVILTGVLDAAGTVFFLLSSTLGRLDVATILSSLYPASTVMLSRLILREQISFLQKLGVVLALGAIVLIVW